MKAVTIVKGGGLENLQFAEKADRTPQADEVKVNWHATSLNYHDYMVATGTLPVEEGRVPMSDGAGEVIAVGSNVKHWNVGDKVMSLFFPQWVKGLPTPQNTRAISGETVDGFAQTYTCVSEDEITAMPEGYSYSEAATLPCAAVTAWRALVVEGNIKAGDTVLVEGTGGMCIFALQIARALGAEVFATTGSTQKIDRLKKLGAKEVINYKEDEKWGKTLFKMTGGIDHVIDVGGSATIRNSIDAVKYYGNIYSIGILGGAKGEILFPKLFFKHIHLIGIAVGSAAMQNDMVQSINEKKWKPIIDKSFSLNDLAAAFEHQASGAHFGKIVVEW